jgi:dihydroorotate dehydrogenase
VIRAFDSLTLPLLRRLDPEDAHRLAIGGLRLLPPGKPRASDPKLAVRAFGLNFPILSAWRRVSTRMQKRRTRC